MLCTLCFDVEDHWLPEADDADLWLVKMLAEEGIRGTFFLTGTKVEALQVRNRWDVLDAIGKMEIGFHTARHSIHPTVFEFTQGKDHLRAVADLEDREYAAVRRLEELFGQRVRAYGESGSSFSPAMAEMLSNHGMAYNYMPGILGPDRNVFWWRDCLAWTTAQEIPFFDDSLPDPEAVTRQLADFDRAIAGAKTKGFSMMYLFVGHPVRYVCREFPDALTCAMGVNGTLSDFSPYLYSDDEIRTIQASLRRVFRHIKNHPDLELTTYGEILDTIRRPGPVVGPGELDAWVKAYRSSRNFPVATSALSAGEGVCSLARIMLDSGSPVKRVSPYGPPDMPRESAGNYRVRREDLERSLPAFLQRMEQSGRLPGDVVVGSDRLGIGHFARALVNFHAEPDLPETFVYAQFPFLAEGPYSAGKVVQALYSWPIHDMNLDGCEAARQTLLATWCMRPVE
jgi:hypothetical protein